MLEKIKASTDFLTSQFNLNPEVGIILGTGLGDLASEIDCEYEIEYKKITNFPVSTVEGHKGKLIFGRLGNKNVVAMQGRFHYYEGYSMQEVVFPVRVMKMLGIKTLIVSNASGGVNPDFNVGDLMAITDHINMFPDNPLRGKNIEELGPRFPDMSNAYDKELINIALKIAQNNNIKLLKGVYAGVAGPTFETPAEYIYIRNSGADVVGMSTVPEVIAARHAGLKCFAISVITDSGVPGEIVEISHTDVQKVANTAQPKLTLIVKKIIESI